MLFPIRGKIINAFACSKQKFFSNEEVQGINKIILGGEYRKNFDVSECKVSKVVFLTDADVDGYHICSLLERMFIMYYPQMIQAGMIYKATPPLYSAKVNGKDKCFVDQLDYIKYNQKVFSQKYQLKNSKKVPLNNKELSLFFIRNQDYLYWIYKLSRTFAVEIPVLEDILISYVENGNQVNFTKLQKIIKSKYRFMNVEKVNNTYIVKGVVAGSNSAVLSDKFFNTCSPLIKILQSNDSLHYVLDNTPMSIFDIMNLYEKVKPNDFHRYKGLGETSEKILEKSVMNPLMDRVLIQYTMDDVKDTIETIRNYESDKKKILSLVGNVTRDDLID